MLRVGLVALAILIAGTMDFIGWRADNPQRDLKEYFLETVAELY